MTMALVALSVAATVTAAHAAPRSRAAKLFDEGKALLARGEVAQACAKLEESDAAEPSVGTHGLLAACLERQGKLASAWSAYLETASRASRVRDDRAAYATERAAALEPRLPRLVVSVAGVKDATVTVGTRTLGPDQLDVPTFVDPGPTVVEAVAPDGRRIARTMEATIGQSLRVELAFEEPRPGAVVPPAAGADTAAGEGEHGFPAWPGFVGLGVGVAGLTVMGVFGAVAVSRNATSDDLAQTCASSGASCDEGREERESASDAAGIATAGLVIGAAGLASAAVLFIVHASSGPDAPGEEAGVHVEPAISPEGARLGIRGAF